MTANMHANQQTQAKQDGGNSAGSVGAAVRAEQQAPAQQQESITGGTAGKSSVKIQNPPGGKSSIFF